MRVLRKLHNSLTLFFRNLIDKNTCKCIKQYEIQAIIINAFC